MSEPKLPRRRNWPTLMLCVAIFLCGAVVGGGIAVIVRTESWPRPRRSIEERADRLASNIGDELRLNTEQVDRIREVARKRYTAVREISLEYRPRMKTQAWLLDAGIRAVLTTDAQRARWAEVYAKLYRKWFETDPKNDVETPQTQPAGTTPFAPSGLDALRP